MKTKEILIIIIIYQTIISSCQYCIKEPFTEDELLWLEPFNSGDTLLFCSNPYTSESDFDTILILNKLVNNPKNRFIFDLEEKNCECYAYRWPFAKNHYYTYGRIMFLLCNDKKQIEGSLVITKGLWPLVLLDSSYYKGKTYFGVQIGDFHEGYNWDYSYDNSLITNLCINNEIIKNCIEFSNKDFSLIWSRDCGIVCYRINDNNYFLIK